MIGLSLELLIMTLLLVFNIVLAVNTRVPLIGIIVALFTFACGAYYVTEITALAFNIEILYITVIMCLAGASLWTNGKEVG